MALFDELMVRQAAIRSATAIGMVLGAVSVSAPALAEFPGESWDVPYVQISGGGADQGALTVGLNNANQTYFYGSKPTKMQANVSGPGKVDIKIIDRSSGTVIAERRGLAYSGNGASATNSIAAAALNWMDSLSCVGDCAVATSGAAPAVQTAEAPAPTPAAQPTAEVEVEAPTKPETPEPAVAEPATETVIARAEPAVELTLDEPKPVTPTAPQPDSDVAVAALPKTTAAEETPVVQAPVAAPTPAVTAAERPTGSLAAAVLPKVDAPESSPSVASPDLAEPATTARNAPKPSGGSGGTAPNVQQGQDADEVLAALDRQQRQQRAAQVQDVVPGVNLPLPRPENLLSELAESLGASPAPLEDVQTGTTLALAEPTTNVEAPTTRGGALNENANVSTGDGDTEVEAPAAATPEPARAEQPEAVTPAAGSGDSPTVGSTDGDTAIQSPTPVARTPQSPAPDAPDADVAAASPSVDASSEDEPEVPSAPVEPARPSATTPEAQPETDGDTEQTAAVEEPAEPNVNTEAPAAASAENVLQTDGGEDEQVALVNPVQPVSRPTAVQPEPTPEDSEPVVTAPASDDPVTPSAEDADQGDAGVEIEVAAVDPDASGPTLANARWVGFTPAVYTGSNDKAGAWIAGPFDRKQRQGWITDTATGATTRVTFIWREAGAGSRTATLSREAAKALGLGQGDVANVAVYLPR
ncbi:MAG: hypothetical protein AAF557_06475 [Pseudomonadota bacterium]